jgi:hypothetical protein
MSSPLLRMGPYDPVSVWPAKRRVTSGLSTTVTVLLADEVICHTAGPPLMSSVKQR